MLARLHALALLLGTAAGCSTTVPLGYHDGGTPTPCGPTTCAIGEYCCSETCGICAPEGAACIERVCGEPCAAFYANGVGACSSILGFAWTGADCAPILGCACEGVDCGRLYPDPEVCRVDNAGCNPCIGDAECPDGQFCSFGMSGCGAPTGGVGTCVALPIETTCPAEFAPVCGCDGVTYDTACAANARGVSILFEGPCDICAPEDATATGDCGNVIGRVWNGMGCVPLVGCGCVGAECDVALAPDVMLSCERRHEGCLPPDMPCGSTACYAASELCVISLADGTGTCLPSPCDRPSCDCVTMAGFVDFMCSEDPVYGGVTLVR